MKTSGVTRRRGGAANERIQAGDGSGQVALTGAAWPNCISLPSD